MPLLQQSLKCDVPYLLLIQVGGHAIPCGGGGLPAVQAVLPSAVENQIGEKTKLRLYEYQIVIIVRRICRKVRICHRPRKFVCVVAVEIRTQDNQIDNIEICQQIQQTSQKCYVAKQHQE